MISSNDLKPGLTILVDGEIYTVLEASQNKTARSAMVVKAKFVTFVQEVMLNCLGAVEKRLNLLKLKKRNAIFI